MFEYMTIRELYELIVNCDELEKDNLDYIELQGWVRSNRNNGSVGFIELNDGTYFKNAQLVYNKEDKCFEKYCKYNTGSALTVMGKFVLTPNNKQPFEIEVKEIVLEGECDEDYPLQKKRHGFDFLREISHLRARTNTFNAVFRVRSALIMAIHEFFQTQGFVCVNAPFVKKNQNLVNDESDKIVELSSSSQLYMESFALSFRDVYCFGPVFNSDSLVKELWCVEPEMAFADLEDNMLLAEDFIKFCINYVLENCNEEISFFDRMIDNGLIDRLNCMLSSSFKNIDYSRVVEELIEAVRGNVSFVDNDIYWGMEFKAEHLEYVCNKFNDGNPVFIVNSPKDIKDFSCRINTDLKTVASCDLVVKDFMLSSGAQREERYDFLVKRINDENIDFDSMKWYVDLRKYGGCAHAGFKLDFEKLLIYLTGITDLRDTVPFSVN